MNCLIIPKIACCDDDYIEYDEHGMEQHKNVIRWCSWRPAEDTSGACRRHLVSSSHILADLCAAKASFERFGDDFEHYNQSQFGSKV